MDQISLIYKIIHQVQGNSIFVQGMIIMWNSTVASIPTGFVLCDGNNGTPDLRGRFVVGHHPSNGDYDVMILVVQKM